MISLKKNDYGISAPERDDGEIYPGAQPEPQKTSYQTFGSAKPYIEPKPYTEQSSSPLPEITPVHTAIPAGYQLCNCCEKIIPVGSVFCPGCGNPADGSSRRQAIAQVQARKACRFCGNSNPADNAFCSSCGKSLSDQAVPQQAQQVVINNYYNNNSGNSVNVNNINIGPKGKNKWLAFVLCLLFGYVGVHKFYEGRTLWGIIYLFTGGLWGVGWIIDTIILLFKPNPYYPG